MSEEILAGLDPEQRSVATSIGGPVCVLAGAGTGKTRAITHRIAYAVATGQQNPRHVMALTFTVKAATEMRTRLRDLGVGTVAARTFHSAALRQLQYFWPQAVGGPLPQLLSSKVAAVAEACQRLHIQVDKSALRDLTGEIEWAKVSTIAPEDYAQAVEAAGRSGVAGFDSRTVARVMARYEDVKRDNHFIDFDDVLILLHGILNDRVDIARQVREQYKHFVVDEYQDVSPLQHMLLKTWLGNSRDLCAVGDAAQTIYTFAGARSEYLTNFRRDFKNAEIIKLERNYRSTPEIIEVANKVLAGARSISAKNRLKLVSQQEAGVPPKFQGYPTEEDEARQVAGIIADRINAGIPARDIAILFRTNSQSEAFEQALASRGIGYLVRGGQRFFEREEVRRGIRALRAALSAVAGREHDLSEVVKDVLSSNGWSPKAPASQGMVREKWESLQALVTLAENAAARPGGCSLEGFMQELDERIEAQNAPEVNGVTLASIHTAKGLEWSLVFVVGVSEGLLPISLAKDDAAIEEERRLFYVALTRAKTELFVTWAEGRTNARSSRKPSRFINGLLPESTALARGPKPRTKGNRKAEVFYSCRVCGGALNAASEQRIGRCSTCPPTYEEELLLQLKAWRKAEAQEQQVPAYVVFTDKTLDAIAERQPRSINELLTVPGIGQTKATTYGAEVLRIISEQAKNQ